MAKVIGKVDWENKKEGYLVYCNTLNIIFPFIFDNKAAAELFRELVDKRKLNYSRFSRIQKDSFRTFEQVHECEWGGN